MLDALSFPFVRFGWWLLVVLCGTGFVALMALSTSVDGKVYLSTRIVFVALLLIGVIVRCYFTIIEHTLTNWGKEAWQEGSVNVEGLWGSMAALLGLACLSWMPAIVISYMMRTYEEWREMATQISFAIGCDYFCLGMLALVVFGNASQILPQHILPAMSKSGPAFMLAGAALVLVPLAFQVVWGLLPVTQAVFLRASIASAVAAFFLIVHARLIGLLYVANRGRLGWED